MNTLESYSTANPKNITDECAKFVIDDAGSPFILSDIMEIGARYTFSFWIKSEANSSVQTAGSEFASSTDWQKYSTVFTAASKDLTIDFLNAGTYYIYHPKLELGNTVTDWSPAPEDVDEDIIKSTDEVRADMAEKNAETIDSCTEMMDAALGDYVKESEYLDFKETIQTDFQILDGQVSMNFTTMTEQIQNVNGELQTEIQERSKHLSFNSDNAITIGGNDSGIILTVDNDNGVIFSKIISNTGSETSATEVESSDIGYQLHTSNTTAPTGSWLAELPEFIPNDKYLWIRKSVYYTDGTSSYTDSVAFGSWDGVNFYSGNIVIRVNERAQFGNFAYVPRSDGSLSFLKVGE